MIARGLGFVAATFVAACTTFYDLEPTSGSTTSAGGAGGEGGALPTQDGLLSRFDAAHTCSVLFACPSVGKDVADSIGIPAIPLATGVRASYSACIDWLSAPLRSAHAGFASARPIAACLAIASSCEGAHRCTATETIAPTDPRCPTATTSTCSEDDWIDCATNRVVHCGVATFGDGASCFEGAAERGCAVGLAAAAEATCDGTTFFAATGPGAPRRSVDCALLGLGCDATPADVSLRGCAGSAGPARCTTPYAVDCSPDGTRARVCTSEGIRAEVDCAAEGGACEASGPSLVRCAPPNAECQPGAADVDVCTGSVLRACLGGRRVDFDCATIGAPCLGPDGDLSGRCGIP